MDNEAADEILPENHRGGRFWSPVEAAGASSTELSSADLESDAIRLKVSSSADLDSAASATTLGASFVPDWAMWVFAGCALLTAIVLLLDWLVIRRNALGQSCCARSSAKPLSQSKRVAIQMQSSQQTTFLSSSGGAGFGGGTSSGGGNSGFVSAAHTKRSTNMLLNKMTRFGALDQQQQQLYG